MKELVLIGGQNSDDYTKGEAWGAYQAGLIVKINIETGEKEILVKDSYRPSVILNYPEIGIVYKAATLTKQFAYICSTTEIIIYDAISWKENKRISSLLFNDIHHVLPNKEGNLLVANTGLDNILEVNYEGEVLKEYCTCINEEEKFFDKNIDYRTVVSTKPHITHPNYVFTLGDDIYATRFKQKDAICLTKPEKTSFQVDSGNIHDGLTYSNMLYFTSTNGWVTAFDVVSGEKKMEVNLNEIYQSKEPLGWCRGIEVLADDKIAVGFSRLRPTKFRENVDWVSKGFGFNKKLSPMPTRIAIVNLKSKTIEKEFNMEGMNMNAIFSIHEYNHDT